MSIRPTRLARTPAARASARLIVALAAAAGGLVAVSLPASATSTVITVNSANDPGNGKCDAAECTLREAIAKANSGYSPATIRFAIGSGPVTIAVGTNLPTITKRVTIDGTSQPGYSGAPLVVLTGSGSATTGLRLTASNSVVKGLVVNGFSDQQLLIEGSFNTVSGSYLGTDATGNAAATGGNNATVRIIGAACGNTLSQNVIGGGSVGVSLEGKAKNNVVTDNSIGLGADGSSTIGSSGAGIVVGPNVRGTEVRGNRIANNGGLGIDTGPTVRQSSPALVSAKQTPGGVDVSGTLDSTANATFTIDLFANAVCDPSGFGEGQFYVGSLTATADAGGHATFSGVLPPGAGGPPPDAFDVYTATATRVGGETSAFSACIDETPAFDPPSPPTGVAVGAGDGTAQVTWLAPDSDGGSPLDHYTVAWTPGSGSVDVPAGTTIVDIPGLTNGTGYTFTVTATNQAALTSDPSQVSETVTPLAGSVAPEAATADLGAGGTLSTGAGATAADPVNTTVNTPNAGTVSIGEGAMTGTPPAGTEYIGQQIDIRAPDASQTDPMRFTFVVDCTEVALGASSCAEPAAPSSASVQVRDGSYSPSAVTVGQGGTVTWNFAGARSHSVTDALCLGSKAAPLFSSGPRSPGSTYSYSFPAAGSYSYKSTAKGDPKTMTGTVNVPVVVSQPTGTPDTSIQVTWATSALAGFKFDVQYRYRAPGASDYSLWNTWLPYPSAPSASFVASTLQGAGDYQFRSRLKNASTFNLSGWSPAASVTIARADGTQHLADIAVFHETDTENVEVPDCTGGDGVAQPAPSCVFSETIRPDGDLEIVVLTTHNNRWRVGKVAVPTP